MMNQKKEINRKSVSTILRDIFQDRKIKYDKLKNKKENSHLKPKERDKKIDFELNKEHFYFRGESSYHDLRLPSLYREENLTMCGSEYYYRALLSELGRADYQENTSLVRLISELQHYGAKTRLLDITKNPLIALYFAVEKDDDKPGYLFVYKSDICKEKFDTGHTIAIKSALNFMPQDVINEFLDSVGSIKEKIISNLECTKLEEIEDKLKKEEVTPGECKRVVAAITKFMELLNQRARVREQLVYPFKIFSDLQQAHIVIPSKTTDRIRQQQGAFIYPRYVSTKNSYESIKEQISDSIDALSTEFQTDKEIKGDKNKKQSFSVIKIDGGNKKAIRNELALLGITEGSIYPDIEHQSAALLKQLHS
ncbi:FRG domain-containing protein [Carnobacteriaceae bacterium zg-ZUI252]|nr:FRG domain-containing protein [Carnobacteriaceae bacterium zg-ZUI252]